jgi:hypothetical protein
VKRPVALGLSLLILASFALNACKAQDRVEVYNPAGIREDGIYVDKLIMKTMAELKRYQPPLGGQFPEVRIEKVPVSPFRITREIKLPARWLELLPKTKGESSK